MDTQRHLDIDIGQIARGDGHRRGCVPVWGEVVRQAVRVAAIDVALAHEVVEADRVGAGQDRDGIVAGVVGVGPGAVAQIHVDVVERHRAGTGDGAADMETNRQCDVLAGRVGRVDCYGRAALLVCHEACVRIAALDVSVAAVVEPQLVGAGRDRDRVVPVVIGVGPDFERVGLDPHADLWERLPALIRHAAADTDPARHLDVDARDVVRSNVE